MSRLTMFETISLDGYFTDANGDMSWAHRGDDDPEWTAFVSQNASGGGALLFGRVTYQMMESFWPTPIAAERMPVVARRMNEATKIVFSRTLKRATWNNTRLVREDPVAEVRRLKRESDVDMAILGSGSIVAQLAKAGLIDEYQLVVAPVLLGAGRTPFDGLDGRLPLRRTKSREFANGNVVLYYEPAR
jgi:dihydrofolate reductase